MQSMSFVHLERVAVKALNSYHFFFLKMSVGKYL